MSHCGFFWLGAWVGASFMSCVLIALWLRNAAPQPSTAEREAGLSNESLRQGDVAVAAPIYSVGDGFGAIWDCELGLTEGECGLEVVRPGKAYCPYCDEYGRSGKSKRAK